MTSKSRLRLEITGRLAFLVAIAALFPTIIAQRRELVWLQATGTCAFLLGAGVALYAGIKLKNCREPATLLLEKVRWTSALAYVVIFVCGFGVFAMLANTRRGWIIWTIISLFLIATLFYKPREKV